MIGGEKHRLRRKRGREKFSELGEGSKERRKEKRRR